MSSRPQWGTLVSPSQSSRRPSAAPRSSNPASGSKHWGTYVSLTPSEAQAAIVAGATTSPSNARSSQAAAPGLSAAPPAPSATPAPASVRAPAPTTQRSARRRSPRPRHHHSANPNSTFTIASGSVPLPRRRSQSADTSGSSDSRQSTVTIPPAGSSTHRSARSGSSCSRDTGSGGRTHHHRRPGNDAGHRHLHHHRRSRRRDHGHHHIPEAVVRSWGQGPGGAQYRQQYEADGLGVGADGEPRCPCYLCGNYAWLREGVPLMED